MRTKQIPFGSYIHIVALNPNECAISQRLYTLGRIKKRICLRQPSHSHTEHPHNITVQTPIQINFETSRTGQASHKTTSAKIVSTHTGRQAIHLVREQKKQQNISWQLYKWEELRHDKVGRLLYRLYTSLLDMGSQNSPQIQLDDQEGAADWILRADFLS